MVCGWVFPSFGGLPRFVAFTNFCCKYSHSLLQTPSVTLASWWNSRKFKNWLLRIAARVPADIVIFPIYRYRGWSSRQQRTLSRSISFPNVVFFFFFFLNWSLTALQCCINFCYMMKWISSIYTYIPSLSDLPIPTPLSHHRWAHHLAELPVL